MLATEKHPGPQTFVRGDGTSNRRLRSTSIVGMFSAIAFGIGVCVVAFGTPAEEPPAPTTAIQTPLPTIYEDWVKEMAEGQRAGVREKSDPFTRLMTSCSERAEHNERVVWEDDTLMLLVDTKEAGSLLAIPKRSANFLIDVPQDVVERLRVASAAACDALHVGNGQTSQGAAGCRIHVNPPLELGVSQLHVHVTPTRTLLPDNKRDESRYYQKVSARLKALLGPGKELKCSR